MSLEALHVLAELLSDDLRLPREHRVELITHKVSANWRQRHPTVRDKVLALTESLVHEGPHHGRRVTIAEVTEMSAELDRASRRGVALSVTSRVWDETGRLLGHMALMNLHPEGFVDVEELSAAMADITEHMPGYLLDSGRFFHYYGKRLLTPAEWVRFLAQFLMPCTVVSPRYIGHSMERGFCSLRLNAVAPDKPFTPRLVRTI
jgi:hypothetical protein